MGTRRASPELRLAEAAASVALVCALVMLTSAVAAASGDVAIVDNGFSPGTLTINVGDTVTWSNTGRRAHTSTSDTGVWSSGSLGGGGTFAFTFNAAGSYAYHCVFHESMHGTIVVQASATATPRPTTPPPPATAIAMPTPTFTPIPEAPAPVPIVAPATPTPTPVRPTLLTSATVDPDSGGTLTTAAGDAMLVFPAGAVTSSTTASFVQVTDRSSARVPEGYRLGTTRLQLTAQDVAGRAMTGFQQLVTLTVRPTSGELADVNDDVTRLTLAQENPDLGVWEILETTPGDDGASLMAMLSRPGTLAVLEATDL